MAIVLSVLRFNSSDYLFGIFEKILNEKQNQKKKPETMGTTQKSNI